MFLRPLGGGRGCLAVAKFRDDTVREGVSHHCHLSTSSSSSSPSLHLGFHVFSSLSLFCGRWYVDFIKFSSGVGDRGGGRGVGGQSSPLCCFHPSRLVHS